MSATHLQLYDTKSPVRGYKTEIPFLGIKVLINLFLKIFLPGDLFLLAWSVLMRCKKAHLRFKREVVHRVTVVFP